MYDLLVRDALTLESVLGSAAAAARHTGGPVVFKVVVVQDLAGLGRKHMYSLGFKALGEMAKVAADHCASRCATGGKGSQELGRRPAGGRWPLSLC